MTASAGAAKYRGKKRKFASQDKLPDEEKLTRLTCTVFFPLAWIGCDLFFKFFHWPLHE